jgi:bifunctional DNase/RNase
MKPAHSHVTVNLVQVIAAYRLTVISCIQADTIVSCSTISGSTDAHDMHSLALALNVILPIYIDSETMRKHIPEVVHSDQSIAVGINYLKLSP